MVSLLRYFPDLTDTQRDQFDQLDALYRDWNSKINVISRKDIDHLYTHHVLHSLAVGKYVALRPFTQVLDVGTGGGFPGVPLAILFPEAHFHLVDSVGKKIKVVAAVVEALGLPNVTHAHTRAEQVMDSYDFVVSRAVAPLADLWHWTGHRIVKHYQHEVRNGLICLKGGDLGPEIKPLQRKVRTVPLTDYFDDPYFETKKLVHVQR